MTSVYSTRWYDRYAKGEGKVDWERSQVGLIKGKTGPSDGSSKRSDLTDLTVWTTGVPPITRKQICDHLYLS